MNLPILLTRKKHGEECFAEESGGEKDVAGIVADYNNIGTE